MHKIGAGTGSGISTAYGYLSAQTPGTEVSIFSIARGIVAHPSAVVDAFWSDRTRVYANLGPSGFLGYFSPWAIGPWSVLLLENVLHRGLGGLGQLILTGLVENFRTPLLVGTVLSIALALVADLVLALAQRLAVPWARTA